MRRPKTRERLGNWLFQLAPISSAPFPATLNLNLAVRDDNLQDYAPAGNVRVCRV